MLLQSRAIEARDVSGMCNMLQSYRQGANIFFTEQHSGTLPIIAYLTYRAVQNRQRHNIVLKTGTVGTERHRDVVEMPTKIFWPRPYCFETSATSYEQYAIKYQCTTIRAEK